ncbi:low specificity L-threonine aldolase [Arthrobacter sp. M4]|uniref:threonine aldolase family protein n=1 Tax=Arthrobacter sp. M4 TaxID=218160 RepID=UPI001CDD6D73|nr:low specificity L-threonine aldolase [Arthrobacter sp. M4]MCA4132699.1 low specificity L-threonine aldolase [Arthrobacter sp. M4]
MAEANTHPAQRLHDASVRGFASDNYSGAHPEILAALAAANDGHQVSYGEDAYTERLGEVMEEQFGTGIEIYPVFNGTGANVLALQSLLPRWGAVVCASTAHINMDENGAPERVGGIKLLQIPTSDGKLTPELIDREAWGFGDEHRAQPLAVSITQTTELGTCYTPDEIRAIADHIHAKGMKLHMDGARLANAAAHLQVPLREFTRDAGVDILSFGGTKNGLLFGEVVVALNPLAAHGLMFLRKMNMQLASKMRFISAQFIALLEDGLWLRSAAHANAMASRLRAAVDQIEGIQPTQATESNGVFAILPEGLADRLRPEFRFYDWDQARREVRWMCSFDTTEEDVDAFVAAIKRELAAR